MLSSKHIQAGRDGHASRCVMYYTRQDAAAAKFLGERTVARRAKQAIPDDVKESSKSSLQAVRWYCAVLPRKSDLIVLSGTAVGLCRERHTMSAPVNL
jgi:superfamily II DNA helicase RecQ